MDSPARRAAWHTRPQDLPISQDSLEAKVGPYAPDFRLRPTNGREIALTDFRRRMKVVLFFIREYS